jgi:uncharacterized protein (TIGR02266 family)
VVRRLPLTLAERSDWVKVFDPRGGSVFVPATEVPEVGAEVRIDLTVTEGGPRVILKGNVLWRRSVADQRNPSGCAVALSLSEKEKVNFLNGYVRGGLINRRERRRLPLCLPVTYATQEGTHDSRSRDINEEGIFILSDAPLPEHSEISFTVRIPGRPEPLQLRGEVSHTVIVEDEDVPGMGVRFLPGPVGAAELAKIIDVLERAFLSGSLPEDVIT